MAISFQTLKQPEIVDVAGIPMRKRGCLTVAEEVAVRDLGAVLEDDLKGLTPLQADIKLKQLIATILIQSRLDRTWTLEKTKAPEWMTEINGEIQAIEPDMVMLDELYTFFMNEQRRWQKVEKVEPETTQKKKLTGTKSAGD